MAETVSLETLFTEARTHSYWQEKPVDHALVEKAYDLTKMAPTSANCSPMRLVIVASEEGKVKLKPCLAEGNVEKTMNAPMTAIIADDMAFYEHLPKLFPHTDAKSWFEGNDAKIEETAFRNSTLQAAYFIIALRAQGLDCGPMSGFDQAKCDEAFFKDSTYRSNFLINIGYGDASKLHPRSPRFAFEDVADIV